MNLFFGIIEDEKAFLGQEEAHHCIKVLRHTLGDTIVVTNGNGKTIRGPIVNVSKKEVEVKVNEMIQLPSKTTDLHLAVALTKNIDRYEFLIEKATELGAKEMTPILSFHSERKKVNEDKLQKKALAANKQSLRSQFLTVNPAQNLNDFVKKNSHSNLYVAHCYGEIPKLELQDLTQISNPVVLIGPEGDFSKEEIDHLLQECDAKSLSLGPNRLRTETAGIYTAAYFYSLIKE